MIPFPDKKYQIIYADPPWDFGGGGVFQDGGRSPRKTSSQYPLMKLKDIVSLPVSAICDKDSLLFLWTTDQHLRKSMYVMEEWGFRFCTVAFYWVKKTRLGKNCYNVGCWTMKSVEQVILGLRGHPMYFKKSRNVKQLIEAERTIHSRKPGETRDRITELVGDRPRIELFARDRTPGWDVWGNEV
jgi:N6-adenosine-specific RNA methylase IME4